MIVNHPENAMHLLRHWLFAKPNSGDDAVRSVHPHNRIFIILASAGPKLAGYLLKIMSPSEKKEIQNILKRKPSFSAGDVNIVRQHFMLKIRGF